MVAISHCRSGTWNFFWILITVMARRTKRSLINLDIGSEHTARPLLPTIDQERGTSFRT